MAESKEEPDKEFSSSKSLLIKVKEESEKAGLKTTFKKLRSYHLVLSFMANTWETMETVTDFIFLGSKIIADRDYIHEIKRHLFLGR